MSITQRILASLGALVLVCPQSQAHPSSGIAVDSQGRIFFTAGPMIVMIDTNGQARTIVHDKSNQKFYQLHHIQRAPDGGLLTASDMGNAIWRFSPDGKLSRFYPPERDMRALAVGSGGDPFAVDPAGNVYAVNSKQERYTQILKVTAQGRIHVLAGGDWGFADGKGAEAKFGELHGGSMLVTAEGALLVTDHGVRVRRVAPDGTVTTLAGGLQQGHVDGPGPDARFDGASGLALDTQGNVVVAEQSGRIRRISSSGVVTTLAGSGRKESRDGALLDASFDEPTGIAVASNGDFLVLEPNGPAVRRISTERVTTIHKGLASSSDERRPR
jgi:hypothetical protein